MSLAIAHGNPQFAGHYAVCVGDIAVPTEIRVWNNGWLPDPEEPHTSGQVIGWVGPLPVVKFENGKPQIVAHKRNASVF